MTETVVLKGIVLKLPREDADGKHLGEILELEEDRLYYFHSDDMFDEISPSNNVTFHHHIDDLGILKARAIRKQDFL